MRECVAPHPQANPAERGESTLKANLFEESATQNWYGEGARVHRISPAGESCLMGGAHSESKSR